MLTTLKRRLNDGEAAYFATDETLIRELGITEDEQREMLTLRTDKPKQAKKERTPRQQWLTAHPQERTAPWKKMGISRRKFFKDRKMAREQRRRSVVAVRHGVRKCRNGWRHGGPGVIR